MGHWGWSLEKYWYYKNYKKSILNFDTNNWKSIFHLRFLFAKKCKDKNIHLAIDTSACNFLTNKQDYIDLLNLVDLWIVDVKSLNEQEHKSITGSNQLTGKLFIELLEKYKKPYWLRQVVIKSINDNDDHINQLANFIKPLKYCQKYELLSYHNLAYDKYEKLGIPYPFKDIKMLTSDEFNELKSKLDSLIKSN